MSAAELSSQFLPIQSLDIEAESRINFDLYVNLPLNNRYIRYRKKGGSLESYRLEKFTEGNFTNFFIQKRDYVEFVKYVSQRINSLLGLEPNSENLKVMQAAAKAILSSTLDQTDPAIAAALMSNLNDITGTIIESSLEKIDLGRNGAPTKIFRKLFSLSEKGTDFQKHPINVTSLAVLITFGIGYSRESLLADVAMAALLHDVGLSKLPPKVINHNHRPLELSIEERSLLYSHPDLSVQVLEEKNIPVSELCKTLIRQHHEEFNGSGYPKGLRGYNINELAQIIRIADEIDQLFTEFYAHPGHLKLRVAETLRNMSEMKVVEPGLLSRVRQVLL
jgi:HD-GYP domain-containing protein (c-di-GMP phosphodiesterase class II)